VCDVYNVNITHTLIRSEDVSRTRTDTREALIQAAFDLIEERGFENLSLRAIARAASVSHAAPYRHFESLDDLLVGVAERAFQRLLDACMEAQSSASAEPLMRFHALGKAYLLFAWANPGVFDLMFDAKVATDERVQSAQAAVFSLVALAISSAQRDGAVASGDPQEIGLLAWSGVHGYAQLYLNGLVGWLGLEREDRAKMASRFTMMVYEGMRPR